jgi:hypothetical protein
MPREINNRVKNKGKGIGTKLLSRFCQEMDACLSPAYLETDTEKNVLL